MVSIYRENTKENIHTFKFEYLRLNLNLNNLIPNVFDIFSNILEENFRNLTFMKIWENLVEKKGARIGIRKQIATVQ